MLNNNVLKLKEILPWTTTFQLVATLEVPKDVSLFRNSQAALCDYGLDIICSTSSAVVGG